GAAGARIQQPAAGAGLEPYPAGWFDQTSAPGASVVVVLVLAWSSQRRPLLARSGGVAARADIRRGWGRVAVGFSASGGATRGWLARLWQRRTRACRSSVRAESGSGAPLRRQPHRGPGDDGRVVHTARPGSPPAFEAAARREPGT